MNRQKTSKIEKLKADVNNLTATVTENNIMKLEIAKLKRQDQPDSPEQPSQPSNPTKRTGKFDLTKIHDRYGAVLRVIHMEHCTIDTQCLKACIDLTQHCTQLIYEEDEISEIISDPTLKSIKSLRC